MGPEVPPWAKCYCVARHFPVYARVLPYQMPGDKIIYLCPTSHHALTAYMKVCERLGSPPVLNFQARFPMVVQRLGHLLWAVKSGQITEEQYIRMETFKRMSRKEDRG